MAVSDWNDYFQSAGQQYGVDPDLLKAVATVESAGDRYAVSRQGAVGPMQLMPDTAKALGVTDPTNPAQAIPAAARLLTQNGQQFGSPDNAVLAYHGGTNQANWGPKTKNYLAKVTDTYQQIKSGSPMASTAIQQQPDDAFSAAFAPASNAPASAAAPAPSGPDAFTAAFGGQADTKKAAAPTVKPSVPAQPWGFKDQVMANLPFAKDVVAGGGAALDTAADAITGSGGPTLSSLTTGNQPPTFGQRYQANINQLDAQQAQYAQQHPVLSPLASLTSVAAAGKPSAALPAEIASLPGKVWNGIKSGATLGGLFGAGESAPLADRPGNALAGAATGATVGATLPIAGAVVRPVAKAVGATLNAAGEKLGLITPDYEAQANNKLLGALNRDQVAPAEVATGLTGSDGKPLTAMDLAGTNTQRLARNLVTQPGTAGDKVTSFLQSRSADQGGRVLGDITQHLSDNTDVYGTASDLVQQRSAAAAPLYQKAFSNPSVITDRLQAFAADPDIQQGMKEGIVLARRQALADGKPFDPNAYAITGFNSAGDPQIGPVPTWQTWQAAKEGLDERIESSRDPVTGKLPNTKTVNSLVSLKNSLLGELDSVNPDYAAARAAWAGPSQSNTAMQMGGSFMSADPEQIQQAVSRLSPGDQDFYRVGAARAIQDKANSASDSADLSKRLFGNSRTRQQIETVFGPGASDAFGQAMGAEGKMASTNRFVLGGPTTANKIADLADGHQELAQDIMQGGLSGGPTGAVVVPAMRAVGRGINNLFNGMHPVVANHLATALTASGQSAAHIYSQLAAEQAARRAALLTSQARGAAANRLISGSASLGAVNALSSPQ